MGVILRSKRGSLLLLIVDDLDVSLILQVSRYIAFAELGKGIFGQDRFSDDYIGLAVDLSGDFRCLGHTVNRMCESLL